MVDVPFLALLALSALLAAAELLPRACWLARALDGLSGADDESGDEAGDVAGLDR